MDIVLRHVVENERLPINGRIDQSITISGLFASPWDTIGTTFSQVRLKRLHIYVQTGVGCEERGYHAINVAPKVEFEVTDKTSFPLLCSLPGTRMARITRMISGVWIPTGPDERMWMKTDSAAALAEYVYLVNGQKGDGTANQTFPVTVTIDAHVQLRRVNYAKLKTGMTAPEVSESFEHLDLDS